MFELHGSDSGYGHNQWFESPVSMCSTYIYESCQ